MGGFRLLSTSPEVFLFTLFFTSTYSYSLYYYYDYYYSHFIFISIREFTFRFNGLSQKGLFFMNRIEHEGWSGGKELRG